MTLGQNVPKLDALHLMDGIEGLRSLPKHSVDMLLTDPPYGTTRNFWDTLYIVIDYDKPTDEDGEQYQTYFLNMVDEADLLAAMQAAGGELAGVFLRRQMRRGRYQHGLYCLCCEHERVPGQGSRACARGGAGA